VLEHTAEVLAPEPAATALCAMRRHKDEFGSYPNLLRPRTFNEKVLYRMAFDRRPILITLQDKYAAREYVTQRVGEHVLPRLYWVTKNPADIPFDRLPASFAVKATHGCGFNYLVPDKARVDWADVMANCALWLNRNYYSDHREWAYKHIEPRIIVEEFISDATRGSALNYKVFVFGGRVELIQVDDGERGDYYGRSWDRLDLKGRSEPIGGVPRPALLGDLIDCAETAGAGLDFIRVDLYATTKVYFGEMTVYPAGGLRKFVPEKWNRYFGDLWDLSTSVAAAPIDRQPTLTQQPVPPVGRSR
jgi:TupA-like ATPgrasp